MESAIVEEFEEKTIEFTIRQSAHALRALSKSLYSRPIEAIVRELVANAYDSHVEARQTRPFRLYLERDNGYVQFRIRDYGTGLSPEDLERLYSTYFDSTKTVEDGAIGSFGLGAKSPFAFTNVYYINTYWFGIKTTYTASIDLDTAEFVLSKNCCEDVGVGISNGLEVYFDVGRADDDFYRAASKILVDFSDVAELYIENRKAIIEEPAYLLKLPHISISSFRQSERPKVRFKRICYGLESTVIPDVFSRAAFILDVDDGIDVTPSREELHYNQRTRGALVTAFNQAKEEIRTHIEEIIDRYPDPYALRKEFPRIAASMPSFVSDVFQRDGIEYRADNQYPIGAIDLLVYHWYGSRSRRGKSRLIGERPQHFYYGERKESYLFAYVPPKGKVSKQWILSMLRESKNSRVWLFGSQEVFEQFRKELFLPDTVEAIPAETLAVRKRSKTARAYRTLYVYDKSNVDPWVEVSVNLDAVPEAIYIPLMYWKPYDPGASKLKGARYFVETLVNFAGDVPIYGIRQADLKMVNSCPGWRNAFDVLSEAGEKLIPMFEGKVLMRDPPWLQSLYFLKLREWAADIPSVAQTLDILASSEMATEAFTKYRGLQVYCQLSDVKVQSMCLEDLPLLAEFPMLKYYLILASRIGSDPGQLDNVVNYLRGKGGNV